MQGGGGGGGPSSGTWGQTHIWGYSTWAAEIDSVQAFGCAIFVHSLYIQGKHANNTLEVPKISVLS